LFKVQWERAWGRSEGMAPFVAMITQSSSSSSAAPSPATGAEEAEEEGAAEGAEETEEGAEGAEGTTPFALTAWGLSTSMQSSCVSVTRNQE